MDPFKIYIKKEETERERERKSQKSINHQRYNFLFYIVYDLYYNILLFYNTNRNLYLTFTGNNVQYILYIIYCICLAAYIVLKRRSNGIKIIIIYFFSMVYIAY